MTPVYLGIYGRATQPSRISIAANVDPFDDPAPILVHVSAFEADGAALLELPSDADEFDYVEALCRQYLKDEKLDEKEFIDIFAIRFEERKDEEVTKNLLDSKGLNLILLSTV